MGSGAQSACPHPWRPFTIPNTYPLGKGSLFSLRELSFTRELARHTGAEPWIDQTLGGLPAMSTTVTLPSSLSTRIQALARRVRLLRAVRGASLLVLATLPQCRRRHCG